MFIWLLNKRTNKLNSLHFHQILIETEKKRFSSFISYLQLSKLEAAPGISFRVGWAHPTPILTPILKNFLHALETFQGGLNILSGGLSTPQPTPGAATNLNLSISMFNSLIIIIYRITHSIFDKGCLKSSDRPFIFSITAIVIKIIKSNSICMNSKRALHW